MTAESWTTRKAMAGLRRQIQRVGIDIGPFPRTQSVDYARKRILSQPKWHTVLDVGANEGQWAINARGQGYKGRIISFEPTLEARGKLESSARKDESWDVVPLALGATVLPHASMNISANKAMSSSLLVMIDRHEQLAPESKIVRTEAVALSTLDVIWADLNICSEVYVKVDIQGSEWDFLQGAARSLRKVAAIEIETSLEVLYGESATHGMVSDFLESKHFELVAVEMGLVDRDTGRAATLDSIWQRT